MPPEYSNRGSSAPPEARGVAVDSAASESARVLAEAIDRGATGLLVVAADGRVMAANSTMAGWAGGEPGAMVGQPVWAFMLRVTEDNWPWRWQALCDAGRVELESAIRRDDGAEQATRVVFELQRPVDGAPRAFISISPTVVRLQSPPAVPEWSHWVAAYGEEGYWDWHVASGRIAVSPRWCALLGLGARTTVTPEMMRAILGDETFARLMAQSGRMARGEVDHGDATVAVRRPGGATIWIRHRVHVAARTPDGQVARLVGRAVDVTAERRTADALRELVERVPIAVLVHRSDGSVALWNRAVARFLECAYEDVLDEIMRRREEGWGLLDEHGQLVPREGLPSLLAIQTGLPVRDRVYGFVSASGAPPRWGMVTALPRLDPHGQVIDVVTTFTDITAHRQIQQALADARRLEGLGRLAGGVAHDFNNMLAAVLGNAELIRMAAPEAGQTAELLEAAGEILAAARRGAALTRQLLGYARMQTAQIRAVPLGQRVRRAGATLDLPGPEIRVALPEAQGPLVWVDPHQLDQVVVELAANARAAMAGGGRIALVVDEVELQPAMLTDGRWADLEPGGYGRLRVIDDGAGMAAHVAERAFDPFFSTRSNCPGRGMGLAMCYGIARQNNGLIRLDSTPGEGTTVEILFPRVGG